MNLITKKGAIPHSKPELLPIFMSRPSATFKIKRQLGKGIVWYHIGEKEV